MHDWLDKLQDWMGANGEHDMLEVEPDDLFKDLHAVQLRRSVRQHKAQLNMLKTYDYSGMGFSWLPNGSVDVVVEEDGEHAVLCKQLAEHYVYMRTQG